MGRAGPHLLANSIMPPDCLSLQSEKENGYYFVFAVEHAVGHDTGRITEWS